MLALSILGLSVLALAATPSRIPERCPANPPARRLFVLWGLEWSLAERLILSFLRRGSNPVRRIGEDSTRRGGPPWPPVSGMSNPVVGFTWTGTGACPYRSSSPGGSIRRITKSGFFSNLASRRLRLVALDLDFILTLQRPGDVVSRLEAYPGLRRGAEGLGEAYRHLARHPRAPVHQVRERLAADAQRPGALGHAQAQRLQTGDAHDLAGMRRILHGHGGFLLHAAIVECQARLVNPAPARDNSSIPRRVRIC